MARCARTEPACKNGGAPELDHAPETASDGLIADPYTLDLQMLLLTGGRERTAAEYAALLEEVGYGMREMSKPASARGASIMEASAERG